MALPTFLEIRTKYVQVTWITLLVLNDLIFTIHLLDGGDFKVTFKMHSPGIAMRADHGVRTGIAQLGQDLSKFDR